MTTATRAITGILLLTLGFILFAGEINDTITRWTTTFILLKSLGILLLWIAWRTLSPILPDMHDIPFED